MNSLRGVTLDQVSLVVNSSLAGLSRRAILILLRQADLAQQNLLAVTFSAVASLIAALRYLGWGT